MVMTVNQSVKFFAVVTLKMSHCYISLSHINNFYTFINTDTPILCNNVHILQFKQVIDLVLNGFKIKN